MFSLIIVDYNSISKTLKYIDHCIEKFYGQEFNIIIVDNSYTDETLESILECSLIKETIYEQKKIYIYEYREHNLVLVKSNENLGYAKGNNLGAKVSNYFYKEDYLIFSNNDLKFTDNINLLEFINIFTRNNDIAVIGPKIVGIDGRPQSPRKYNNIWRQLILYFPNILLCNILTKYITNIDYSNESKYTYWVMGCFIVVDSNKFFETGMFDENTFLYAEEMILSERMLKKGYKNYFYNDIEVVHEHGQTVKKTMSILSGMEESFKSNCYYFKNYKNVSKIDLILAKVSFKIFKRLFPIKCCMKKYIQYVVRRKI